MARALAAECLPFFAQALLSARLVVTRACPSLAAIDAHWRVYFHPDLVEELLQSSGLQEGLPQLAWVWIHEISHALRRHGERCAEHQADATLWNVAADLEINDGQWTGLVPPRTYPPLFPHQFALPPGGLAEQYYDQLKSNVTPHQQRLIAALADEGSGVHGEPRDWELPEADERASAVPALEQETIRIQVARNLEQQKSRGHIPGGWLRWINRTLRPQLDWRTLLLRRVRGAITTSVGNRVDYTYQRVNRRQHVYAPFIRPSLSGQYQPTVACVIDTSGSMSTTDLAASLGEVRGVLDALHTPITLIACDAVAYEPIQVLTASALVQAARSLRGGGGTDMVAGIEAALALRPAPDAVIVLTDGWTNYPPQPYRTPVIFAILQQSQDHPPLPRTPPWKSSDVVLVPPP